MKKINIKIEEKDKMGRTLSLLNVRDELVNFLYKDTVASSTQIDLKFLILLFFISVQDKNKSLLEKILDDGLPRFIALNTVFSKKSGKLGAGEYRKMVEKYGLAELFERDLFFVILESVLNIHEIKIRFSDFLKKDKQLFDVVERIEKDYYQKVYDNFSEFKLTKITDNRYDDKGNFHDLSKSVYRTVLMRTSRNFNLNIQRYTEIKNLTSSSPIVLDFIQNIDPQIIFDLWDRYQVVDYAKNTWDFANNSPIISNTISGIIGGLIVKYSNWKKIDGNKERTEKRKAKEIFEKEKKEKGQVLDELTMKLVDSVLKSNERLQQEIEMQKEKLINLSDTNVTLQDKKEIKKLEKRIKDLENLHIKAELSEK